MTRSSNDESFRSWRASARSIFAQWKDQAMSEISGNKFDRIEQVLRSILTKMDDMDAKLQELLNDDYYEEPKTPAQVVSINTDNRFIDEEEIYQHGQRIPYNRIVGNDDMEVFRDFVMYIRLHERQFSAREIELAAFADKNFSDIRISDNTRRVLGQSYTRINKKAWPISFERGYMIKWKGQIAWEWADGTRD